MAPQPKQYSADELENLKELLTEEELEGMLDEDLVDDDPDAEGDEDTGPFAPEPDDDDDDAEDDGDDANPAEGDAADSNDDTDEPDPAAADPAEAQPDADAGAADPGPVADDDALPEIDLPAPPTIKGRDDADRKAELTAANEELVKQKTTARERFREGEISEEEYEQAVDELSDKIAENKQRLKSAESVQTEVDDYWFGKAIPAFIEQFPEYQASPRMWKLLDQVVREVQVDEATKDPNHPDVLRKAHRIIEKEYGLKFAKTAKAAPAPAADIPKPADKTKRAAPGKTGKREIPPTLGRVPAAEHSDTTDTSKWAAIDRLKGVAYEEAVAKLSDEDSDAYEAWLASR